MPGTPTASGSAPAAAAARPGPAASAAPCYCLSIVLRTGQPDQHRSPRRNVALSQPSASTGRTGRPAHCGNCEPTSRDTRSAVISALRTSRLSQPPGSATTDLSPVRQRSVVRPMYRPGMSVAAGENSGMAGSSPDCRPGRAVIASRHVARHEVRRPSGGPRRPPGSIESGSACSRRPACWSRVRRRPARS